MNRIKLMKSNFFLSLEFNHRLVSLSGVHRTQKALTISKSSVERKKKYEKNKTFSQRTSTIMKRKNESAPLISISLHMRSHAKNAHFKSVSINLMRLCVLSLCACFCSSLTSMEIVSIWIWQTLKWDDSF